MIKIAILGGTGKVGSGLALRWARAGHSVIVGSRSAGKAEQAASRLTGLLQGVGTVAGLDNPAAAAVAEVVVLSVPYDAQLPILESVRGVLAGKLLISVVVPLRPPAVSRVWHPPAGSAAQEAQGYLGEVTSVVIAFQNVSAGHLINPDHQFDSDVLICGDIAAHKQVAAGLVVDAGLRPIDAGPLANAGVVEGLTAVLIGVNKRHSAGGTGLRITGLGGKNAG